MCGIAGVYRTHGAVSVQDYEDVARMLTAMAARGPDGERQWRDDRCVLGHRWLAIQDTDGRAQQPLHDRHSLVAVSCNGEIYNHRVLRQQLQTLGYIFETESDSEVLLHGYKAWGLYTLIRKLHGMFAFALYDKRYQRLYLARDRIGIKPLYVRRGVDGLSFASTVQALGGSSQDAALQHFLQWGSVTGTTTTRQGVETIEPGTYWVCDYKDVQTVRYWGWADVRACWGKPPMPAPPLDIIVQSHLQAAVPVAVLLSGGVDSAALSLITKLPAVTLDFPHDQDYREIHFAQQALQANGHFQQYDARSLWWAEQSFFSAMDQPTIDGINTYWACSTAAMRAKVRVVLSGLGADEVFGGYEHSRLEPLVRHLPLEIQRTGYRRVRGLFTPHESAWLMDDDVRPVELPDPPAQGPAPWTYWEFRHYLHDQLLRDSDCMSLAHGVELRVPYLDDHLLPYACYRPWRLLWQRKPVLMEAVKGLVPDAILKRPKQGFTLPMATWLTEDPRWEALALSDGPLNKQAVQTVWREFHAGRLHWSRPWATVVASQWKRWT